MQTVTGRNVNHVWGRALALISTVGERDFSARTGKTVLVAPYPVMSVTMEPRERVLFDPARDANPFFHLFESLWMLAGRGDAKFLNTFVKDYGERFAEKNGRIYGAYGYRWRHHFEVDQIETCIARLRKDPTDRRVVIAMWNPDDDLLEPDYLDEESGKMFAEPRDVPCNTHIYLRIRGHVEHEKRARLAGMGVREDPKERNLDGSDYRLMNAVDDERFLDLTVCCRSNDIVWGAYGANIVHFSFLQEYIAGRLNVQVGRLYQLSNNWHAYTDVLDDYNARTQGRSYSFFDPFGNMTVQPMAIGTNWSRWMEDLEQFMADPMGLKPYVNPWFSSVAKPMYEAHSLWRRGERKVAHSHLDYVAASDWQLAAHQWMERRLRRAA